MKVGRHEAKEKERKVLFEIRDLEMAMGGGDLRRDVVGGRDGVTPIASLDGICPCTVSCKDSYTGITLSVSANEMSKMEMK